MTEWKPARSGLLLQTLETALAFFVAEGPERPFRSEWRKSLQPRDSGIPHAIRPVTAFHPDAHGDTVASVHQENTQKDLDGRESE